MSFFNKSVVEVKIKDGSYRFPAQVLIIVHKQIFKVCVLEY